MATAKPARRSVDSEQVAGKAPHRRSSGRRRVGVLEGDAGACAKLLCLAPPRLRPLGIPTFEETGGHVTSRELPLLLEHPVPERARSCVLLRLPLGSAPSFDRTGCGTSRPEGSCRSSSSAPQAGAYVELCLAPPLAPLDDIIRFGACGIRLGAYGRGVPCQIRGSPRRERKSSQGASISSATEARSASIEPRLRTNEARSGRYLVPSAAK